MTATATIPMMAGSPSDCGESTVGAGVLMGTVVSTAVVCPDAAT